MEGCLVCKDLGWILFFNPPQTQLMTPIHPDNTSGDKIPSKHIIFQPCTKCLKGQSLVTEVDKT